MRVICINNKPMRHSSKYCHLLKEGEVYTAIRVVESLGMPHYDLAEIDPNIYCFRIERFIPLSDIDETELVNQKPEPCVLSH